MLDPFGFCGLKDGLTDSERFWRDVVGAAGDAAGWVQTGIHTALDVAGVFDPSGVTDLWNSAGYAGEALSGQGGWRDSAISAAAVVPYIGDLGKAGKYGAKAAKAADKASDLARAAKKARETQKRFRRAQGALDQLEGIRKAQKRAPNLIPSIRKSEQRADNALKLLKKRADFPRQFD